MYVRVLNDDIRGHRQGEAAASYWVEGMRNQKRSHSDANSMNKNSQ